MKITVPKGRRYQPGDRPRCPHCDWPLRRVRQTPPSGELPLELLLECFNETCSFRGPSGDGPPYQETTTT